MRDGQKSSIESHATYAIITSFKARIRIKMTSLASSVIFVYVSNIRCASSTRRARAGTSQQNESKIRLREEKEKGKCIHPQHAHTKITVKEGSLCTETDEVEIGGCQ